MHLIISWLFHLLTDGPQDVDKDFETIFQILAKKEIGKKDVAYM